MRSLLQTDRLIDRLTDWLTDRIPGRKMPCCWGSSHKTHDHAREQSRFSIYNKKIMIGKCMYYMHICVCRWQRCGESNASDMPRLDVSHLHCMCGFTLSVAPTENTQHCDHLKTHAASPHSPSLLSRNVMPLLIKQHGVRKRVCVCVRCSVTAVWARLRRKKQVGRKTEVEKAVRSGVETRTHSL